MPTGFTRPFTPQGLASSVPPLPWRFAGDLLLFHFRTDPEAIRGYLPEPLQHADASGEAFLWSPRLCCYPTAIEVSELPPASSAYNVCVVGLPATLDGERTLYSTFQWCDRDWLVLMSWFLGACSKLASFEESAIHPLFPTQGIQQTGTTGTVIKRTVSRQGQRVVTMGLTLEETITVEDLGFYFRTLPLTSMRHIPGCTPEDPGRPLVHDLTQMAMENVHFGEPQKGPATLRFHEADNEELLPLQPHEVIAGYKIPMAFTLSGVRSVHDYLKT